MFDDCLRMLLSCYRISMSDLIGRPGVHQAHAGQVRGDFPEAAGEVVDVDGDVDIGISPKCGR